MVDEEEDDEDQDMDPEGPVRPTYIWNAQSRLEEKGSSDEKCTFTSRRRSADGSRTTRCVDWSKPAMPNSTVAFERSTCSTSTVTPSLSHICRVRRWYNELIMSHRPPADTPSKSTHTDPHVHPNHPRLAPRFLHYSPSHGTHRPTPRRPRHPPGRGEPDLRLVRGGHVRGRGQQEGQGRPVEDGRRRCGQGSGAGDLGRASGEFNATILPIPLRTECL